MFKNWSTARIISYQVNLILFFLCCVAIGLGYASFGLRALACNEKVIPPGQCTPIFETNEAELEEDAKNGLLTHGNLWTLILLFCIFTNTSFSIIFRNLSGVIFQRKCIRGNFFPSIFLRVIVFSVQIFLG